MKLLLGTLLLGTLVFASEVFEKDTEYICLNTYNMEQGAKVDADPKNAKDKPFIFTIKDDKLITSSKVEFNYMMQKGKLISYSNDAYMLLLQDNMNLGLVPKKSRGAVQFYFKCVKNK